MLIYNERNIRVDKPVVDQIAPCCREQDMLSPSGVSLRKAGRTPPIKIKALSEDTTVIQKTHIFIGQFLAKSIEEKTNESRSLHP